VLGHVAILPDWHDGRMRRKPVKSSVVRSVGYDAESKTMELEFSDGSLYEYYSVPAAIHRRLMEADSIGGFLNRFVVPGYKSRKI
jgi:hypothetical protein